MKKKIGILYGGPSSEHDVSVSSAKNVISNIDTSLYDVIEVYISKDQLFNINGVDFEINDAIKELKSICDVVFPVLHGAFGEDGTLQGLLENASIPFVGSGSVSSRLAIDKNLSNIAFAEHEINIPRSEVVSRLNPGISINFPVIIKPVNEGSSVGLYKCKSEEEFNSMKEQIFSSHDEMLAQEFVTGREFTCGILEVDGKNIALPVSEIILNKSELFNYEAKYTVGKCIEVTPAEITLGLSSQIQEIALKCHEVLGCKSLSRTDVILSENGLIYVLETNTLPGMTKTSFIPAQAEAAVLSMQQLVSRLLESAGN